MLETLWGPVRRGVGSAAGPPPSRFQVNCVLPGKCQPHCRHSHRWEAGDDLSGLTLEDYCGDCGLNTLRGLGQCLADSRRRFLSGPVLLGKWAACPSTPALSEILRLGGEVSSMSSLQSQTIPPSESQRCPGILPSVLQVGPNQTSSRKEEGPSSPSLSQDGISKAARLRWGPVQPRLNVLHPRS